MKRLIALFLLGASTLALAACGDSAKSLLTGSIMTGKKTKASAPSPAKSDPLARPVQVGWVSARASRCGFYFDPAKLKQQYLAAEAATGMPLDQLRRLELTYDYSLKSTAIKIAKVEDYCTERRAKLIRKDLQRHLAGDYTPRTAPKKNKDDGGLLSLLDVEDSVPEKFDPEAFNHPDRIR